MPSTTSVFSLNEASPRAGNLALSWMLSLMPDVTVCSAALPGMHGADLLRHLARRQWAANAFLLPEAGWQMLATCVAMGSGFAAMHSEPAARCTQNTAVRDHTR
ncbi:MAG: hypothetical protein AB3X44_20725 [Leptothrix sp. (in: b-proteobacteria)]